MHDCWYGRKHRRRLHRVPLVPFSTFRACGQPRYPYETRPWTRRVEHPFGTISVSPVSGGLHASLTLWLSDYLSPVRIASVRSCITNGVPRGASVRWYSSRGFWPVECQMTSHAARLIASVIVSGTGAKEIDARAAPWHCHREHNGHRLLNASESIFIPRRILSSTENNIEMNGTQAGVDRRYNE